MIPGDDLSPGELPGIEAVDPEHAPRPEIDLAGVAEVGGEHARRVVAGVHLELEIEVAICDRLVDEPPLGREPLRAEPVDDRDPRRVVGDADVLVAAAPGALGHLQHRGAAVGPVRVAVKVAAVALGGQGRDADGLGDGYGRTGKHFNLQPGSGRTSRRDHQRQQRRVHLDADIPGTKHEQCHSAGDR